MKQSVYKCLGSRGRASQKLQPFVPVRKYRPTESPSIFCTSDFWKNVLCQETDFGGATIMLQTNHYVTN